MYVCMYVCVYVQCVQSGLQGAYRSKKRYTVIYCYIEYHSVVQWFTGMSSKMFMYRWKPYFTAFRSLRLPEVDHSLIREITVQSNLQKLDLHQDIQTLICLLMLCIVPYITFKTYKNGVAHTQIKDNASAHPRKAFRSNFPRRRKKLYSVSDLFWSQEPRNLFLCRH